MSYIGCYSCGYTDEAEKFSRTRIPTINNPLEKYDSCPNCDKEKLDYDPLPAYEK